MNQPPDNNNSMRVDTSGAATGPLPARDSPEIGGQPTTYAPPEIGYQGNVYPVYAVPPSGAPTPPVQSAVSGRAVSRGRHRHSTSLLGPLLLIGAGVVFLLNNLGVLPWGVWETLGRLWPLFLIAIGIDLVVGRRKPLISLLIILGLVVVGVALVYANAGFF